MDTNRVRGGCGARQRSVVVSFTRALVWLIYSFDSSVRLAVVQFNSQPVNQSPRPSAGPSAGRLCVGSVIGPSASAVYPCIGLSVLPQRVLPELSTMLLGELLGYGLLPSGRETDVGQLTACTTALCLVRCVCGPSSIVHSAFGGPAIACIWWLP